MKKYRNEKMFSKENLNAITAYMLGFFVADGSMNTKGQFSFYLHERDEETIQKMVSYIFEEGHKYILHTTAHRVGFCMNNNQIIEDLKSFGIVPDKSHKDICWPDMNDTLYIHFLRGLIDGDGSLFYTAQAVCVQLLGSKSLLTGAAEFVSNLIEHTAVVRKRTDANVHIVKWYKGSRDLLKFLYDNAPIALARKYEKFNEIMKILDTTSSHRGSIRCNALRQKDIIDKYRTKVSEFVYNHDRTPTYNEFRKMGSLDTVYKYFGSFNKMISALGYQPRILSR